MENEITLYQLNMMVSAAVTDAFPGRFKVSAEISEQREHSSGHCYLELIQKDPSGGQTIARARANIWASTYRTLRPYFEQATGRKLQAGVKVLVTASVSFHPNYHYSLTIWDIDPTYTIGDMARRRAEIIKRLTDDGIIDDNKKTEWNLLPRRIAIISSPSAAGYGDFMNQLHGNARGYRFYTALFAAAMQGDASESSIIGALERIFEAQDNFDCVVIIRGGGATSELNCFDSYPLAQSVAQFPLPVIVGIGHERDETVLDYVANTRVKTPTAAAEKLIEKVQEAEERCTMLKEEVIATVTDRMQSEKERIALLKERIPNAVIRKITREENRALQIKNRILYGIQQNISRQRLMLANRAAMIKSGAVRGIEREKNKIELIRNKIELSSPDNILKRGYSITTRNGYPVKSAGQISEGDEIETILIDGKITSEVKNINTEK